MKLVLTDNWGMALPFVAHEVASVKEVLEKGKIRAYQVVLKTGQTYHIEGSSITKEFKAWLKAREADQGQS